MLDKVFNENEKGQSGIILALSYQVDVAGIKHVTTPISVDELAFLCNTSISTFKRKFFKIYGTSPQKWLTQQKMRIAANLLKHPHERPGSVYEKVGYENQSSFILAFKKQYGMTPREYQQTNLS
jgi:AraC-like DNA-binding protein